MKDKVSINGVELTRAQVEAALADLNRVEVAPVANLTRVKKRAAIGNHPWEKGIVIKGTTQNYYRIGKGYQANLTVLVEQESGGGNSYVDDAAMLTQWEVVE